jgi:hypothetical protein
MEYGRKCRCMLAELKHRNSRSFTSSQGTRDLRRAVHCHRTDWHRGDDVPTAFGRGHAEEDGALHRGDPTGLKRAGESRVLPVCHRQDHTSTR